MTNSENFETGQLGIVVSRNIGRFEREAERSLRANLKGDRLKTALDELKISRKNYQEKRMETRQETRETLGEIHAEIEENYLSPEAKIAEKWAHRLIEVQKVIWLSKLDGMSTHHIEKYTEFAEEALYIHLYYNLKNKHPQKIEGILRNIKRDGDLLVEYISKDSWPSFSSRRDSVENQQWKLEMALEKDYPMDNENFALEVLPHLSRIKKMGHGGRIFQNQIELRSQRWARYYDQRTTSSGESWQCYKNLENDYKDIASHVYNPDQSRMGSAVSYSLNRYLDDAFKPGENLTQTRQNLIEMAHAGRIGLGFRNTYSSKERLLRYFLYNPDKQKVLKTIPIPNDKAQQEKWWATRFMLESKEERIAMVKQELTSAPPAYSVTRLDLYREINEENIAELQTAIATNQSLSKRALSEDDKKSILKIIEESTGLNLGRGLTLPPSPRYKTDLETSEPFKTWVQTMTREAKAFLENLTESDEYTGAEILLNHLDIFVEECVRDSTDYTQRRSLPLQKKYPTFLSLIARHKSPQVQSWIEQYRKVRREKLAQEIPALQSYYSRKDQIIESAQQEVRRAQLSYDAQKEGLTKEERSYLDNMEHFVQDDLPSILEELPWLFGDQKENLERMSTKLSEHTKFPKFDIRAQKAGIRGTAYLQEYRYEIDNDVKTYQEYSHTSVHEMLHVLVGNTEGQPNFYTNLSEGITEMLSHRMRAEMGQSPTFTAYPGVVEFVRKIDQLDPTFSAIFYTRVDTPKVNFNDLPKVRVDGTEKTYIDGVVLETPEAKYLCRVILDNINPDYISSELSYTKARDAFDRINPLLKDLFNTSFLDADYTNGAMDKHYFKLTRRLEEILA